MVQTFFRVVTPQEALRLLLQVSPVTTEGVPTVRARGRVLAEDLYSAVDLPHFHRAAMDGYAVKAKDTFGASQSLPAYLKLAGVMEMGKEATRPVATGEAIRISTGGMMPSESDAVVMVEYADEVEGGLVEIHRGVSPWQNVIQIGDDIKKGEMVFHGISISPGKLTIFAKACGKPILGLPGYPVSALVIFDLFAGPLIRRLAGQDTETVTRFTKTVQATLKTNISSQVGREDYVRVTLERDADRLLAIPLPTKSGAIFTLVKADGMVRIDLNQDGLEPGEEMEVILF